MRPTLYGVLEHTRVAAAELRAAEPGLSPDVDARLARFESAIEHAMHSSPDGEHVAQPEEMVAIEALCDLHLALRDEPEPLRDRFRPIVETWISFAASTGLTPHEMAARATAGDLDAWLDDDRSTN